MDFNAAFDDNDDDDNGGGSGTYDDDTYDDGESDLDILDGEVATVDDEDGDDEKPKKAQGTLLVEMALARYTLGCTDEGVPFAVPIGGHVARLLRGGKVSLRAELAAEYYRTHGTSPGSTGIADALRVLEGLALEETATDTFLRVSRRGRTVYVDTADSDNNVIVIEPGSWRITNDANDIPIIFHRTELTLPIDEPVRGSSLDELWSFINVDKDDRPLVAAWLASCYLLEGLACPIASCKAQQGSAKTWTGRTLSRVVDPSPLTDGISPPNSPERWQSAATGSRVMFIDNISTIPDWLSDSLCRAVTGTADTKRTLYTDSNHSVLKFRRAIVMNGIDFGAVRGDLADRMLMLTVKRIDPQNRKAENELDAAWNEAEARIRGAVLDLAARVLAIIDDVQLETRPRMADFANVVKAVDMILGTDGLGTYLAKAADLAHEVVESSPFIYALQTYVLKHGKITGMPSGELYSTITNQVDMNRDTRAWPKGARGASAVLDRYAPELRKLGWTVDDEVNRRTKNKEWTITPPPNER